MHENQKKILAYLKKNPNATYESTAKALKLSGNSVVVHHIRQLMQKGLLQRGSKWIVK